MQRRCKDERRRFRTLAAEGVDKAKVPETALDEGLPTRSLEGDEEPLVRDLGLGQRGPAAQRERGGGADLLEATIDLGVDAGDEEAGHARDPAEVTVVLLETGEVGLHHLGVAIQAEDQGDVDAATLGDHRLDRRHSLRRGGDLHVEVRFVDRSVQPARGVRASSDVRQDKVHTLSKEIQTHA